MGLCSTQAKVTGPCRWQHGTGVLIAVSLNNLLCEPDGIPLYVGLPSALGYLEFDYIFFPISLDGLFSGTLTDINERINHWLWRRSSTPHRYTNGGKWKVYIPGDFEGNMNF